MSDAATGPDGSARRPVDSVRTLPDAMDGPRATRARNARRVVLAAVALVVALGLAGLFDPVPRTQRDVAGSVSLTVQHARVVRAGQPTVLDISVTRPGGFDAPIRLELGRGLLDRLDFQNWYPNPSDETGDDRVVEYEFTPPDGTVFDVRIDARAQPNQLPSVLSETATLLDNRGDPVATTSFSILVMP